MDTNKPMITVLYFEDEPGNFDTLASIKYGLDVQYATSGAEGIKLFESDPMKWDAIILDANMPYDEGKEPSLDSLQRIEKKIGMLSGESIPFFRYSAHGQLLGSIYHKESWQDQAVYDKADPDSIDALCRNILRAVDTNRTITAVIKRKYPEVSLIPTLGCDAPSENELIKILKLLETQKTPEYDPDRDETIYNQIRVVLEWFFRFIYDKGIIQESPTTTNINACSVDLGRKPLVPVYIKRSSHSLVENCNEGSHGTAIRQDTRTGECPYAVKSTIYDLLNILHWAGRLK